METRTLINGTCPECRGPLTEVRQDDLIQFECLVGHVYSPRALLDGHFDAQERTLWAAVVSLEEAENLVKAVRPHLDPAIGERLEAQAREKHEQGQEIRRVLERLQPYELE